MAPKMAPTEFLSVTFDANVPWYASSRLPVTWGLLSLTGVNCYCLDLSVCHMVSAQTFFRAPLKQTHTYMDNQFSVKVPRQFNEQKEVLTTNHAGTTGKHTQKNEPNRYFTW